MVTPPLTTPVLVSFAWSEAPALTINVRHDQSVRDAITSSLPPSMNINRVSIVDTNGNDMTNMLGAQIENSTRVIVSPAGVVEGGYQA